MKLIKKLCLLCALTFALTGCFKTNITLDITRDGNAKMSLEVLVQDEVLTSMGGNLDLLKESFTSEMDAATKDAIKFTDLNKTIDEQKWVGFNATFPEESSKEFKKHITTKGNVMTFEVKSEELNKFGGQLNEEALGEEAGVGNEELEGMGMENTLTINMPGKITQASVGKFKGGTLTVDLIKDKTDSIKVVSELAKDNTMLYVGIGIGAVVVLGAIFFFVRKNKKGKVEIVATQDIEKANTVVDEVEAEVSAEVDETLSKVNEDVKESINEDNKEA